MSQPIDYASEDRAEAVGRIEIIISTLLRVGVIASLTIILIGMTISYLHHPGDARDPELLRTMTAPGQAVPNSIREVAWGVAHLRGQAITALGLLILIATPVFRVAVSIAAFAVQHDTRYVIITCIVLALLLLSFVLGHAGA